MAGQPRPPRFYRESFRPAWLRSRCFVAKFNLRARHSLFYVSRRERRQRTELPWTAAEAPTCWHHAVGQFPTANPMQSTYEGGTDASFNSSLPARLASHHLGAGFFEDCYASPLMNKAALMSQAPPNRRRFSHQSFSDLEANGCGCFVTADAFRQDPCLLDISGWKRRGAPMRSRNKMGNATVTGHTFVGPPDR
jgi:hypothetical protein